MWWLHLAEGYALDLCVRSAQLALAMGRLARVEMHVARPDALWRRLLSPQEKALLVEQTPTLEQKEAGLADLMTSVAALLSQGEDAPIDMPEVTISVVCRPSDAVAPCDTPHTWLVLTQLGRALAADTPIAPLSIAHLQDYERCFAFAPLTQALLPPCVQRLPVAVDREVFKRNDTSMTEGPRILLIGQGDKAASFGMAQQLLQAGAQAVTLFDPYLPSDITDVPLHVRHVGASTPQERLQTFLACQAVVVADPSPAIDNHFMWEAVACGATPLAAHVAPMPAWTSDALREALLAHHGGVAPRWQVPISAFSEVAAMLLGTPIPESLPAARPKRSARTLPTVVACHGGNRSRLAKQRHLGISVATQLILKGLQLAAPSRFEMQWLDYQGPDSARGRFYLYPQGEVEGRSSNELDYVALPERLAHGAIDALCSCDPVADDVLGARQLWANRALPVVSMLHSLHGHGLAFHWLLQMLQFEILPCDAVISPSRCGATAFEETYASAARWLTERTQVKPPPHIRIDVVPYGIDRTPFMGLHRAACRHTLGLPHDAVLLLTLGRFSKREKADLLPLLLSLHALRRAGHNVSLLLAGGTASTSYIQHLRDAAASLGLRDAVRFFGGATSVDKKLLLGAADVFVSVSDNVQETYGLALIEAMAAKLPVVASAWNGAREIVRDGETGFLVPTAWQAPEFETDQIARLGTGVMGYGNRDLHESVVVDIPQLTAYLESLVKNPDLRERMGQRGFEVCRQDYDLATQGSRMADLLVELMGVAAKYPWQPDRTRGPFMSETARRFSHYPSGTIGDAQALRVSPEGADGITRRSILRAALDAGCPEEVALAQRIVKLVNDVPGITLEQVSAALTTSTMSKAQARLRVVRCWKYGLLQRDSGTCSWA